jgi:DNA-binding response OmpR family regulator
MTARVLIVEDEDSILLSLEFLMSQAGYDVLTARDGAAAMRLIGEEAPDLVLLDVMLPLLDGFEVCRLVRGNPALPQPRIMMVTARGRETEISRGLALGANAYLTKPFSTRDLMEKVRSLLQGPERPAAGG